MNSNDSTKNLELEIFKVLKKNFRVRLKVLVNSMIEQGFRKGDVYQIIRWKLSDYIMNPKNPMIVAYPMVKVVHDWHDGKLCKVIVLSEHWSEVDEEDVEAFFNGAELEFDFNLFNFS